MQSTLAWMKGLKTPEIVVGMPVESVAEAESEVQHHDHAAPTAPVEVEVERVPGPELKVMSKGAKLYGICPHCESMWNIRERLMHPTFRRLEKSKGLTCPACDKSVSLPASIDLRKLS